jgi:hypothetical protein
MASQSNTIEIDGAEALSGIVETLNEVLGLLDQLGMTVAGAQLSTVLDTLASYVIGANENDLAIQS